PRGKVPNKSKRHRGRSNRLERPQVLVQNGKPTYVYMASGINIYGGKGTISYVFRLREALPHFALNQRTRSSSYRDRNNEGFYLSARAVDGKVSGQAGEVFYSDPKDTDPWWEVDLGKNIAVSELKIFGSEKHRGTLKDIVITLFDCSGRNKIYTSALLEPHYPFLDKLILSFPPQETKTACRVRISRPPPKVAGTNILAFSEVIVRGAERRQ
ncbi:MAG: hypothetical protein AAF975_05515, partial [Spirochaetota bacterium]